MLAIAGYQVSCKLYESDRSIVYRGCKLTDDDLATSNSADTQSQVINQIENCAVTSTENCPQPVIIKILKQDYPSPQELVKYKQEYEITHNLDLDRVIKSFDLEQYQNTLLITFEDFDGEALDCLYATGEQPQFSLPIEKFLEIAIKIADGLAQIHSLQIIHKDINPANIVLNPTTGQLKLIDFGISTILSRENPTIKNPHILEGTLAYLSPEQTGRMNRSIDYRTDFYSLGVTFYELLTQQLPFRTNDVMELVHSHLAKQPVPPHQLNAAIPSVVSDMVLKLMAKMAEDRYQSAYALKADLEQCLGQWRSTRQIEQFEIASNDISERFQIPQKLYGREAEIKVLLQAFERVAQTAAVGAEGFKHRAELLLVSGYSGMGKSALVRETYRPLTAKRGYFIAGKFDQYQRNVPYFALIEAFQELVQQLLKESEIRLQRWRSQLMLVLGNNGQVIIDVIPAVELLIGPQPAIAELPAREAQNRFRMVFQNFVKVFAKIEHPLIIFLDDLQWADLASLHLVQTLVSESVEQCLFCIGAYRDNEVSPNHPLMAMVEQIRKENIVVSEITLKPLSLDDVNQLVADTLRQSLAETRSLAELVINKTAGNPFFMNEFLKSLYTEHLINFEPECLCWQWRIEQIAQRSFTDNVVTLMADKIQKLPHPTQEILQLAACVGNRFDLDTLAMVLQRDIHAMAMALKQAIQEEIIVPIDDNYKLAELEIDSFYTLPRNPVKPVSTATNSDGSNNSDEFDESEQFRSVSNSAIALAEPASSQSQQVTQPICYKFVHDRVQQAAYLLISPEQRQQVHYQIGQLLLEYIPQAQREQRIFDIVNQLNHCSQLISDRREKQQLAELNLTAGQKAQYANAFETALGYLQIGLDLLAPDCWQSQYELALTMHITAARAASQSGEFELTYRLISNILAQTKNTLDQAGAYEIKILTLVSQNRLREAVAEAVTILKLLGVSFPAQPNQIDFVINLAITRLFFTGKRIESLLNLPTMTNPRILKAMQIMAVVIPATFFSMPSFCSLIVFKMLRLTRIYGNSPFAISPYINYALLHIKVLGDIEPGYRLGQLALDLQAKFDAKKMKPFALVVSNVGIKHWRTPMRELIPHFSTAYAVAMENGDLFFAATAIFMRCAFSYLSGGDLPIIEKNLDECGSAISQQLKQQTINNHTCIYKQAILNLMGKATQEPYELIGTAFDETASGKMDGISKFFLSFHKLVLNYLFDRPQQAYEYAIVAQQHGQMEASPHIPAISMFEALTCINLYEQPQKGTRFQRKLVKQIKANRRKLKLWGKQAPSNYKHKYFLVAAEWERLFGSHNLAMEYYDRAIDLAQEHKFLNDAAIANELAAKFYLTKGKLTIAQAYMLDARHSYLRWGAIAKVRDLEIKYQELLPRYGGFNGSITSPSMLALKTTSGGNKSEELDLLTVIKATQAMSSEIVLSQLLEKLMAIMIENAGATRGAIISWQNDRLVTIAESTIDLRLPVTKKNTPIEETANLPISVVNYVARAETDLVLNDAYGEGNFADDPYINSQQPKSLLCIPIINQGRMVAILYLENNLSQDAFTEKRLELLKLLSSQAAISLENAQLYASLEEKVSERTIALQRANKELERLASLDGLTRVANRRRFDQYLQQQWQQLAQQQKPLSLILCDVDYFKRYNDTYGHIVGDEGLRQVAAVLSESLDHPDYLVARYGGEEFAIILPNTTVKISNQVAETIQSKMHSLKIEHATSDASSYLTLSLGIASMVPLLQDDHNPTVLVNLADYALYEAKEQGRDRIHCIGQSD
ncbi:serine/threonine protein kinase [Thalassoporum mexicanum PCC 7367]|uniref:diguanylate cyclase domain-containing protein n=1 Tax=Thalassoporum mexicanum TaxID=3457544 RepID=UPI00029F9F1C|nr:diguanylate cyclase [Pseudanabaena sp. PCC 7367]AFY69576.1 serine/threonine protein kinase [Pseudanabaena sp. PCC 7367]